MRKTTALASLALALLAAATGCGSLAHTQPERSAREQLLISAAADRALAALDYACFRDRKTFVDSANLTGYDHAYALGRLRNQIAYHGGRLVDDRREADLIVEIRAGALSIDESKINVGTPEVPLILFGTGFKIPEISLFRRTRQMGKARLAFFVYDARDRRLLFSSGTVLGQATSTGYLFLFVIGPFVFDDPEVEAVDSRFDAIEIPQTESAPVRP